MPLRHYYVYIVTNHSHRLYIGVTNDLERRMYEHKLKLLPGHTRRYNINQLVYYEAYRRIQDAIEREKQLKRWRRAKKIALIEVENPHWEDLSADWFREDDVG